MDAATLPLWRQADFLKFWASHTVSQIGSQVTFLALPLTAILTTDATAGKWVCSQQ